MGKADRSNKWFIRITAPWEHIEIKYKCIREWVDHFASAIGYHIGNKTGKAHCHIVLELNSTLQKQSIDIRLKTLFGVKGSDFSSVVWDGDKKALSYLYHDKKGKVEINMKLTDDQLKEIERLVVVYDEIVTTAKAKASNKCVDHVLEVIKESARLWSRTEIVSYIYRQVRLGTWHAPGPRLTLYLDEIRLRQGTDADGDDAIDAMTAAFLRGYERFS